MEYDEIGKQIDSAKLMGAFKALRWQLKQSRKVAEIVAGKSSEASKIPLKQSERCTFFAKDALLELSTHAGMSKGKVFSEFELLLRLVQSALEPEKRIQAFSESNSSQNTTTFYWNIPEQLFKTLYDNQYQHLKIDYLVFRNQLALKVLQQLVAHHWLLTYLTGCTPFLTMKNQTATPQRSAVRAGAGVPEKPVDYRTLSAYIKTRPAFATGFDLTTTQLENKGVQIESVRSFKLTGIELNPFEKTGFKAELLDLLSVMTAYFMCTTGIAEQELTPKIQAACKFEQVVARENPFAQSACYKKAQQFIASLLHFVAQTQLQIYQGGLEKLQNLVTDSMQTPAAKLLRSGREIDAFFLKGGQSTAGKTKVTANMQFLLKAALKEGKDFEIISQEEQLLRIENKLVLNGITDAQTSALYAKIWHARLLCQQLVQSRGIGVPNTWTITNPAEIDEIYELIKESAIVVKGSFTTGALTFRNVPARKVFRQTVHGFLKKKQKCVIEQYQGGAAYRVLLVKGQAISMLERIPQNIVGDGHSPVSELITRKQKRYAQIERDFPFDNLQQSNLILQGRKETSILARGEQLFLRYDATTGTGEEYLECLSEMDKSYLQKIRELAQILHLQNGAIDIILPNLYQPLREKDAREQFIFLNAHAEPSLTLHEHTLMQQDAPVAEKMLQLLLEC
ncbi:hypothetical protein [Liquorilactobacillus satsumensis]|uniref:hypothetical protein n=1 Tax=Liquorilactobacillus satsumensis TaxID=259059 RepID=UPI0039E9E61E